MKTFNILLIIFAFMFLSYSDAPAQKNNTEVNFQNISLKQALKQSKKDKKYIFMNTYAVWCAPCNLLKKTTFKSDKVAKVLNKNFINLSIDVEKGDGINIGKAYQVTAHPLMLILDSEGNVVKRIMGYMKDNQLLAEVKEFIQ